MTRTRATLLLVLLCFAGASDRVFAQANTSSGLVGEVKDSSGGLLPGATITATRAATGLQQTAVTDAEGRYRLPSLPQGEYRVEASLSGFQPQVMTGVVLTVGRTVSADFTLSVGALSETVTVEGGAPLVETQSSSVAGLVSGEQVRDLPLNGRSFDQLITLSPATVMFTQRQNNAFQGTANQFSSEGTRPNQSRIVVDGSELAGAGGNHSSVNTASGKLLGVEAIQEFQVITNNSDASYGKKAGGQVSIITRSGTNRFAGSAFVFLRNDIFDARDFFDRAKAPLNQHNTGFALGGPIKSNRSFFFTNYERYRERRGLTLVATVPTMAVRQGRFPDGSVATVHPDMAPILALYPEPNGRDFGDGTAEASTPVTKSADDHYFVTRMDHVFSDTQSLFSRYLLQAGQRRDPNDNNLGRFLEADPFSTHLLTAGHKSILTSKLLNQATVSWNRAYNRVDYVPADGVTVPTSMILVPGQTNPSSIQVQGGSIPNLSANTSGGTAEQFVDRRVFLLANRVSYSAGAHFLDAGVELHRIQSLQFSGLMARGSLRFANLRGLVTGVPNQFQGPKPGSDGNKDWRENYFGVYLQDAYRVRENLTLNLGLRWEHMSNPRDTEGRTSAWTPDPVTLIYPNAPTITDAVFAENRSGNWAPRVGFAWDVLGDSRMAVRGGVGIFYTQMEDEFRRTLGPAPPFWNSVIVTNPPFPNPGPTLANATLGVLSPSSVQPAPKIPTITQFNLRVERALGSNFLVAAAYLGARGHNLGRTTNPQLPPPTFSPARGRLIVPLVLMNTTLSGAATYYVWDADSSYDGTTLEAEKRLSRGLRFKAAYTFSKAIDEGAGIIPNYLGASAGSPYLTDHTIGRGPAAHNVRQRFVFNWSYELPLGTHRGLAGAALNGWQLAGILQMQDGFPFTVSSGVLAGLISNPGMNRAVGVDLVPGRSNNPVLGGPDKYFDATAFMLAPPDAVGTLGSNTLVGPGVQQMDVSLTKTFTLNGTRRLQFRLDSFNVLNHPNFGLPDTVLYNPNGTPRPAAGRINGTATTGREFQVGLKLLF